MLIEGVEAPNPFLDPVNLLGGLLVGPVKGFIGTVVGSAAKTELRSAGAAAINIKFPGAKQIAKELGTDVRTFHKSIKPGIIKDFATEIKSIGARNPDIGYTEAGHIVFQNPKTGMTAITDVLLETYKP